MSVGYYLPRLIPLGAGTEMITTGEFVRAEEALALGLVHRVVPAATLDDAVGKLVTEPRDAPPIALAFAKSAIGRSLDPDRNAEFDYEVFAQVNCIQTEDRREGVSGFFDEKRVPVVKGR